MVKPGTPKLTLVDYFFDRARDPDSEWASFENESGSAARSKRESTRDNWDVPSFTICVIRDE